MLLHSAHERFSRVGFILILLGLLIGACCLEPYLGFLLPAIFGIMRNDENPDRPTIQGGVMPLVNPTDQTIAGLMAATAGVTTAFLVGSERVKKAIDKGAVPKCKPKKT